MSETIVKQGGSVLTPNLRKDWDRLHSQRVGHDWVVFFAVLGTFFIAASLLSFKIPADEAYLNFVSYVVAYPLLNIFMVAFMKHADANNNFGDITLVFLIIATAHIIVMSILAIGWAIFIPIGCIGAGASFCVDLPWQFWFHVITLWLLWVVLIIQIIVFNTIRRRVAKINASNPSTDSWATLLNQKDGSIHSLGRQITNKIL